MKYDEFEKRVKSIEIQIAIVLMLRDARILSAQMHNVQHEFEKNDIHGLTPGIINKFNKEHQIMIDALGYANVLVHSVDCDLGSVVHLVNQLLVDYEHGNYEFEE